MKNSLKGLFVILAIVMSLIAVQNVCAEQVTGAITSISTQPNTITVNEIEIHGVKFGYLCNQYNICLEEGDLVTIEYYDYLCSDGSILFKACTIIADDVTVKLRECL